MSNSILRKARELAPELDWMVTEDPVDYGGDGDGFAAAAIGLEGAPATITIAKLGERWICELIATRGTFAEPGGERQIFCLCKGATTPDQAWEAMLVMFKAAGSVHLGLEAARQHAERAGELQEAPREATTLADHFTR
jgi:hypothetical protein